MVYAERIESSASGRDQDGVSPHHGEHESGIPLSGGHYARGNAEEGIAGPAAEGGGARRAAAASSDGGGVGSTNGTAAATANGDADAEAGSASDATNVRRYEADIGRIASTSAAGGSAAAVGQQAGFAQ